MTMEDRGGRSALGLQILDLPLHVLSRIFLHLPVPSLLRCRCVCTTFRKLVNDSCFRQLYFSRAPTSFVVLSEHLRLFCIDCCAETLSSNHGSSCQGALHKQSSSSTYRSGTDPIRHQGDGLQEEDDRFASRFIRLGGPMNLVNSCNGLLCLRGFDSQSRNLYHICNPILGEFLTLPPPPSAADEYLGFSAFGFDPLSGRYKILQLVLKSNKIVAELYQLGDENWSVIENATSARPNSAFDPSLNGALHWVTDSTNISDLICSFDLHSNEFKSVPPPCHMDVGYVNKISGISIGVLGGCLCLCYVSGAALFETWLMEEYGVKESWTRRFIIDIKNYCGLRLGDKQRPIGFTSYGDMWLKSDSGSDSDLHCLVSYSAETASFKVIHIGGISSNIEATRHVMSFVSLKDMVNVTGTHLQFQILKADRS